VSAPERWYAVATLTVTDPSWIEDYVREVTPMLERHGGRYLARTSQIERLDGNGQPPQVLLVVEWPSREAARTFFDSDEYRPYRERRLAGAGGDIFLLPGRDDTGRASPPAGYRPSSPG
jgi:uncharacterized protein (DUF1330 family)